MDMLHRIKLTMKRLFILLVALPLLGLSSPAERILPKTLEIKTLAWYTDQAKAWKQETTSSSSNASAWLNYYTASVFAQEPAQKLTEIIRQMETAVPDSFELLVAKGWNKGLTLEAQTFLKSAYARNPERPETYALLQMLSEYELDPSGRSQFSDRLLKGAQVSASLLNYSYNVLQSVAPSSILITEGENTTIPLYLLQDAYGIRKDVCIINLEMLNDVNYLQRKFKAANITYTNSEPWNVSALCAMLPKENAGKKFYYALTIPKENVQTIKEYLYVVGLASLHSLTNVDNISQIRKNLEKEFLMDYLLVDFNGKSSHDAGKQFSPNYLLPMILLYESYIKEGSIEKARELKKVMEKIAQDTGNESIMARFLDNAPEEIPYYPSKVNIKSVDDGFRQVYQTIYAFDSEVTNEQYNLFLNYLKDHNLTDLYEKYKFDFSEYSEPTLSLMKGYTSDQVSTKKNKGFSSYPAVNLSYEAAVAYCDWLTEQYNRSPEHKFKRVKFRLPSLNEWQLAAAGIKNPTSLNPNEQKVEVRITPPGKEFDKNHEKRMVSLNDPDILYPWFRYYGLRNSPINSRGCYLGNFKVSDQITCPGIKKIGLGAADGFFAMSATKVYFPNDIGLFDVVGNVAEMIQEKGKACGGSWNHVPEESTIKSINSYTKPDAAVGFRIFMEVIEK